MEPPDSREYELLVQQIVRDLSRNARVYTTRLQHDMPIQGRSTINRIDVVWDFTDASGQTRRVVFECRSYKSAIKQQALHSWRSVVDDIQSDERPVVGVMVTTVGYQIGARRVADTYDLLVLELRQPTEADLANRVSAVRVQLNVQPTVVDDMRLEIEDGYDEEAWAARDVWVPVTVRAASETGPGRNIKEVLLDGETGTFEAPMGPHPVRRVFDPPLELCVNGESLGRLRAASATVGVGSVPPVTITVGGLETVAWMVRDAISGARLWLGTGGRVWSTDS